MLSLAAAFQLAVSQSALTDLLQTQLVLLSDVLMPTVTSSTQLAVLSGQLDLAAKPHHIKFDEPRFVAGLFFWALPDPQGLSPAHHGYLIAENRVDTGPSACI